MDSYLLMRIHVSISALVFVKVQVRLINRYSHDLYQFCLNEYPDAAKAVMA
jgi:hypothetical protein